MFSFILILIGVFFLLRNLGVISGQIWDFIWPILLIVIGFNFLRRKGVCGFFRKEYFGWRKREIDEKK